MCYSKQNAFFVRRVVSEKTCRFHFMSMHYPRQRAEVSLCASERRLTTSFLGIVLTLQSVFKVHFSSFGYVPSWGSRDAKIAENGCTCHVGGYIRTCLKYVGDGYIYLYDVYAVMSVPL